MSIDTTGVESAEPLIELALEEDLHQRGDITSLSTIPVDAAAEIKVVARQQGRLSGAVLIERVYRSLSRRLPGQPVCQVEQHEHDGAMLEPGTVIATVSGPVQALLSGERTALNFLIHLSGIASLTAAFVEQVGDCGAAVLDTRKTLPGYRQLQKYAVRCGGGVNHRMGLYDGILIKDNHLAARGNSSVAAAVTAARDFLARSGPDCPVEVEVDTLEQLADVLTVAPDIVLLDNMTPAELKQAVSMRDRHSPSTLLEASGGITLQTVSCAAAAGVDRISIGGLTHSAPAFDIGYDWPAVFSPEGTH